MKAMDLLKYLDRADPQYIEEASDYSLLLYRKRRKRTRLAVAACLALVVLAGVLLTRPALYAWETRNTVASWRENGGFVYLGDDKPSSPVMISAEMPDRKKFTADTPFTLSVGLGQTSDYEYATLSINAEGFEITDKDGNTVTDRYVRTLSDFDSGDFGVLYNSRHNVTGCAYLEDFTFRYVGSENTTGWGTIKLSLKSRDESSTAGETVTVYYTLQNGVLKLTDKSPVRGDQNGGMGTVLHPEEETESGAVTLAKEDISIRADMPSGALTPWQYLDDKFQITAFHIPSQKDYPTEGFTAELVYAESLREEDYSFFIKRPFERTEEGALILFAPRVPTDAPIGSYDLRITDSETGFVWVFENMVLVLPPDIPAYEDFTFETDSLPDPLMQGDYWLSGGWEPFTLTLNGEDVADTCRAELQYRTEDDGVNYSITILESMVSSLCPADFVPVDAPVGWYDLVVTHALYGYTWRAEYFIEISENPDAARFGLYHSMGDHLRINGSSEEVCTFIAKVENRGTPITLTVTPGNPIAPEATLVIAYSLGGSGELFEIPLLLVSTPDFEPYEWTWQTGKTVTQTFEIMVTPDTPCGLYDLTLSFGDCTVTFEDVVEVVP